MKRKNKSREICKFSLALHCICKEIDSITHGKEFRTISNKEIHEFIAKTESSTSELKKNLGL